ncbi:hypothetical protein QBC35DRAFT_506512 [Podospora australis]|uniref:DUF6314 domain-containing protein n=1 Tax=Podospora australis TaxID=1536484 RepID=A0AAN7AEZ9_9PEZI|nr:hypothetical protein QBC35DRAFT_506512 [Podospora australis]
MPKTVCIVGAGPSGLVAAKSLLHDAPKGTFDVTVFDSQTRIGGLWPSQKTDNDGLVHPLMVANQSKHTVQFSDLAWEDDAPELPRAWQVGRYLELYHQTYCQEAKLILGTRVEKTETTEAGWQVHTKSPDGTTREESFDYLLIASGFFGRPVVPESIPKNPEVPVVHSSQYRNLKGLLGEGERQGSKILVVGGQMSGVEIAGTIATHLSAAVHAPGTSLIPNVDKYTVHHIVQKPVWVMPLFLSPKPSSAAPPFLPLDIGSYNLATRSYPLTNNQGHISTEAAKHFSTIYECTLGTNQAVYSPCLTVTSEDASNPQFLAVSDNYMEFVRSGLITLSRGKLDTISGKEATVSPSNEKVDDIAAVVLATGFEASISIDFLPPSVKQELALHPDDLSNTVALGFHNTYHPAVPNLGFVGFYRSPYWGVMEMQARFLTNLWSSGGPESPSLSPSMKEALANDTSIQKTLSLRTDPRASQFPMGDYVWLMQEFAAALDLTLLDPPENMRQLKMDTLTPARYPSKHLSEPRQAQVDKSLRQTEATIWAAMTSDKFAAKAVFRSLLGEWKLERELISKLPSHPSGHFSGTAKFLLRAGTREGRESEFDRFAAEDGDPVTEYLYIEEGDFKATNGFSFRATRRYVWRYNERKDELSVWFVKTDDQKRADYLFHRVEFAVPDRDYEGERECRDSWRATAGHLCIDDFYDVNYRFNFQAVNLRGWRLAYTVKGPQKDYTIDGVYTR